VEAFFVGLLLSVIQSMLVVAWLVSDHNEIDYDI
jgi:hypothetical protein